MRYLGRRTLLCKLSSWPCCLNKLKSLRPGPNPRQGMHHDRHTCLQKHYFLGLKILDMLVAEFNQPIPGRTLTQHRKMSVSFRDQSLYGIFELALTALRQLRSSQAADTELREGASLRQENLENCF